MAFGGLASLTVLRISSWWGRRIGRIQRGLVVLFALMVPLAMWIARAFQGIVAEMLAKAGLFLLGFLTVSFNVILVFELLNFVSKTIFHTDMRGIV